MREQIKQFLKSVLGIKGRIGLSDLHIKRLDEIGCVDKGMQILIMLKYRELARNGGPMPSFDEIEFRTYSQNGEDGIVLYLFSVVGTTNKKTIDLCAGTGMVSNTANLIINHGWLGLLIDGNPENVRAGNGFYAACPDTAIWPPTFIQAWVTAENVNDILRNGGMEGEIDFLSLDLDGVDYWIWKAIDCVSPRVVVVEYQDILGPNRALTVPYSPDFRAEFHGTQADYAGASLPAFVKLGREKGYRLVGCQRYGFNAFFVRNGIGDELFPEIAVSECFKHPWVQHGMKHRLPNVIDREWVEV